MLHASFIYSICAVRLTLLISILMLPAILLHREQLKISDILYDVVFSMFLCYHQISAILSRKISDALQVWNF
jgi:hypothetical protein